MFPITNPQTVKPPSEQSSINFNELIGLPENEFLKTIQPFLPEAPVPAPLFHVKAFPPKSSAKIVDKLENAVRGMMFGERYFLWLHPEQIGRVPSQEEYLRLALAIRQYSAHGIGLHEILAGWERWARSPDSPEHILSMAFKSGCSPAQIGAYQAYSKQNGFVICRAMCWAILFAGLPEKAIPAAYADAFLSGRGDVLDAAIFFTTAIAYAFFSEPRTLMRETLYSMSDQFVTDWSYSNHDLQNSPLLRECQTLYFAIQPEFSIKHCFEQLKRADRICFLAAGAIYGAFEQDFFACDWNEEQLAFLKNIFSAPGEVLQHLSQLHPDLLKKYKKFVK